MKNSTRIENAAYNLVVDLMAESDDQNSGMPTFSQLPRDEQYAIAASVAQMMLDYGKQLLNSNMRIIQAYKQPEFDQNADWEMNELGCTTEPCEICGSTTYAECSTRHPFI